MLFVNLFEWLLGFFLYVCFSEEHHRSFSFTRAIKKGRHVGLYVSGSRKWQV